MLFRLHILNGPLRGQQLTVSQEPMLVGRGDDCTLVIPDPEMALHHAVFEHREAGLFVRDLGAMGRVLVNRREQHDARIKHGDVVELAQTRLLVQAVVQSETPAPLRLLREKRFARWLALLTLVVVAALAGSLIPRYLPKKPKVAVVPLPVTNPPPVIMVVTSASPSAVELRKMREEIEIVREALRLAAARTSAPPIVVTVTSPPPRVVVPVSVATKLRPVMAQPPAPPEKIVAHPLVKIVATDQQRLPEQAQLDELRILNITLAPTGHPAPAPATVTMKTEFFDEDQYSGQIALTEAFTPRAELHPEAWHGESPITLTASYAVPAGLRDRQLRAGRKVRYAGYRIRVYVAGALQAEQTYPRWLLEGSP
ncbi:MAG: FHA domain-containing protein [Kiritimatiellaeota bacterium]|nr:FHA domain-containing protein [Kiritimatiellota bacterium]